MAVYTISDLHLPGAEGEGKSMAVFGDRWRHGREKLIKNWSLLVSDEDTVVIPGDISWAMTLQDAYNDFALIDSLPGKKIIGKGNHDFWWSTASKMKAFFKSNSLDTIVDVLYNNAFFTDEMIICGSRGWFFDEMSQKTVGDTDFKKIAAREELRLRASLSAGDKLRTERGFPNHPIVVFLHFPPIWNDECAEGIISLLQEYDVKRCCFGHIHGGYTHPRNFSFDRIDFSLVSADFLDFAPIPVIIDDKNQKLS